MTTLSLRILQREAIRPPRRLPAIRLQGLAGAIRAAWRRRQSRTLLSQLDERMLRDIGVTRADAQLEANKPFWLE
jgi:uncharacterized protein YjiS (DUF1127 family)